MGGLLFAAFLSPEASAGQAQGQGQGQGQNPAQAQNPGAATEEVHEGR